MNKFNFLLKRIFLLNNKGIDVESLFEMLSFLDLQFIFIERVDMLIYLYLFYC